MSQFDDDLYDDDGTEDWAVKQEDRLDPPDDE